MSAVSARGVLHAGDRGDDAAAANASACDSRPRGDAGVDDGADTVPEPAPAGGARTPVGSSPENTACNKLRPEPPTSTVGLLFAASSADATSLTCTPASAWSPTTSSRKCRHAFSRTEMRLSTWMTQVQAGVL